MASNDLLDFKRICTRQLLCDVTVIAVQKQVCITSQQGLNECGFAHLAGPKDDNSLFFVANALNISC
jgi:hypothetical protein